MFPSFWAPGRMGGPRPTSWASVGLPSCFLSGLLGRGPRPLGSLPVSFFLGPGWDGWAAAKKRGFGWVPFIFLFWALVVGWVSRGQEAGAPGCQASQSLCRRGGGASRGLLSDCLYSSCASGASGLCVSASRCGVLQQPGRGEQQWDEET